MDDCLILGGGVIGLSLAYELAGEGQRVRVVDRQQPAQEASWAGAGILPPHAAGPTADPYAQLAALSFQMHPPLAEALRAETGIDTGLRRCGGIYLARDAESAAALAEQAIAWRESGIDAEQLTARELAQREPELLPGDRAASLQSAYRLADEHQLRNPRHLKALLAACRSRGVEITPGRPVEEAVVRRGLMREVVAGGEGLRAGQFCFTTGAWTGTLLRRLGLALAIKPIRGQIVLLQTFRPPVQHIINAGRRYLVPRPDGYVLVGSTEEDAGFDATPTAAGITGLLQLALDLVPALRSARVERSWAGLRPSTFDGRPYLGQVPDVSNAFVAAGHFRAGLELAPATAAVMSHLMRGEPPQIDLGPFRLDRPVPSASHPAASV